MICAIELCEQKSPEESRRLRTQSEVKLRFTCFDPTQKLDSVAQPSLNWRGALAARAEEFRVRTQCPQAHISIELRHEAVRQDD